ncbi:MAG TPA: hypothetical protein VF621_18920, partial [Pyrinomonadaceae bacterium]
KTIQGVRRRITADGLKEITEHRRPITPDELTAVTEDTQSPHSPPRQALVWAALDLTIYSALNAAWYYNWLSPRANTSRRQRPIEYSIDNGFADTVENDADDRFTGSYDRTVNTTGTDRDGHRPEPEVIHKVR